MPCSHCQTIAETPAAADLYLAPSPHHVATKVRDALAAAGAPVDDVGGDTIRTSYTEGGRDLVLTAIADVLSDVESHACQALVMPVGQQPGMAEMTNMTTLAKLVARTRADWLTTVLQQGRLTTHFQPIVAVSRPDTAYAYECLTRGVAEDGSLIPPTKLFDAARAADLIYHLDRATRIAAIENAIRHDIATPIFINFNPTSIYDANYCLETTIRAVERTNVSATQIVFEVVESDEIHDIEHLLRIVKVYREAGCRVALDDFGAGYSSVDLLARLQPDFVKFDRALLRDITRDTFRGVLLMSLLDAARELGIESIVEGVETEEDWKWIAEQDVDYAQGYYIARPASPPPVPFAEKRP